MFERRARAHLPQLRRTVGRRGPKAGCCYSLELEVPHYERRRVQVFFRKGIPRVPMITVDGPAESPHRFSENRLCIWHPEDPEEERWVVEDGLHVLLGLITAHLFREAWWRETGEWLGPQAPHDATSEKLESDSEAEAT